MCIIGSEVCIIGSVLADAEGVRVIMCWPVPAAPSGVLNVHSACAAMLALTAPARPAAMLGRSTVYIQSAHLPSKSAYLKGCTCCLCQARE